MGNKPLIVWSRTMSVGVAQLDAQHRKLIAEINRLQQAADNFDRRTVEDCLAALATYALKHFHDEESHMRKVRYDGLDEHQRIHDEFTAEVHRFRQKLAEDGEPAVLAREILDFLVAWFKDHILSEDQRYAALGPA